MLKEYAIIVAVMGVFTLSATAFIKDMAQDNLCKNFENSASHEFCQKEASK
jgi:hypothetical protein